MDIIELKNIYPITMKEQRIWGFLRLLMGWIFLWPFLDKLFGFGIATKSAQAWVNGGSPTMGFLKLAAKGPFADFYHGLAGQPAVDWAFMLALLVLSLALFLGIGMQLAAAGGTLLLALIYTAALPPANNPFLDEHIVYAVVLIGLAFTHAGRTWGLGLRWISTPLVQHHRWLE